MFEKNMLTVYLPDCAGEKTGLERASMVSPCQRWGHNQACGTQITPQLSWVQPRTMAMFLLPTLQLLSCKELDLSARNARESGKEDSMG